MRLILPVCCALLVLSGTGWTQISGSAGMGDCASPLDPVGTCPPIIAGSIAGSAGASRGTSPTPPAGIAIGGGGSGFAASLSGVGTIGGLTSGSTLNSLSAPASPGGTLSATNTFGSLNSFAAPNPATIVAGNNFAGGTGLTPNSMPGLTLGAAPGLAQSPLGLTPNSTPGFGSTPGFAQSSSGSPATGIGAALGTTASTP